MRLFPSDRYQLPLAEGHRSPVEKYRALRKRLEAEAAAGAALEFIEPHAATDEEILRVHKRDYVGRVMAGTLTPAEVRRIGFPWSEQLVARSLRSTGAAVDAAAAALAFVALDDEAAAVAAAQRLRARGLLVNVVDRPTLSDFRMGSIIDRAPVTVAISTGGATASLAREVINSCCQ